MRTVVVVDDHSLIAEALSGIISGFTNYRVLYEVYDGEQLMSRMSKPVNVPDVVLLDINMPIKDGFETARWLTEHHPDVSILALSMQDKEETLIRIIRCGAKGFILKNCKTPQLKQALDSIIENGFYYPDHLTHKVLSGLSQRKVEQQSLSPRELEFLQYVATELNYKQIAEKMFCSPRTIDDYRDSLYKKFNLKSRVGLAMYALRNDLIKL